MEQTTGQREELLKLQNINLDFSTFQPVRLDQAVLEPIKPKKQLIVAFALVAGLTLGVFVALIRIAVEKSQQRRSVNHEIFSP